MKILGIQWSCSTAALMIDGTIVACASEERFSRVKNEDAYPLQAITAVLKEGGVDPAELDLVACAGERFDPIAILTHKHSRFSIKDRLMEQNQYWHKKIYEAKDVSFLDVFKDRVDTKQYPGEWGEVLAFIKNGKPEAAKDVYKEFRRKVVSNHLGIDTTKIVFSQHHRSHGYYAYYGSPMEKERALILTADAWGDDMNASVSIAEGGNIRMLSSSQNFNLGRLYRYMTLLLGMKPDEHEYKVMGLAPYAKEKYYKEPLEIFRNTLYVDGLGFKYKEIPRDHYFYFKEKLEGYRFDSIAGALQKYAEELLVGWARNALHATKADKICFGGGVGMNVKAMMEIAKLPELDEIFVCPSPSDESLAIGACYAVMHEQCVKQGRDPRTVLRPLKNAYLGPDLDAVETTGLLGQLGQDGDYLIREGVDLEQVARLIASGKIVGRCAGRSEFGARALGNRSILADPRNLDVVKIINQKVKSRDFWMPFAPSILEERADDYLLNPKGLKAPYMTIAFETTSLARRDLRAALHQADLTCRPQIVSRTANARYHALLSEFERLTGVGGVLNTSFNIHGEPIIQTPSDGLDVLQRSDLDALVLGDYFVEKKEAY